VDVPDQSAVKMHCTDLDLAEISFFASSGASKFVDDPRILISFNVIFKNLTSHF